MKRPASEVVRPPERERVQSLARGLAVIQAFRADRARMTLTEVATTTNMTRAAARRFLLTLEDLGFVASDGKYFSLTPHVLRLGYAYLSSLCWWHIAQPFMEEVARSVQESCSAAALDGDEIVYLARVPASRIMSVNLSIGTRLPAYCTSMGRVLLAHKSPSSIDAYLAGTKLEKRTARTLADQDRLRAEIVKVRAQGYSVINEELEAGVRSVAVPLFDRNGNCIAALNIGGAASRATIRHVLDVYLPTLQEASRKTTAALP
ncbi:MAG: helix-turn-helix domain-containing protein [Rhodospirillaceae bacterium]|nr:helix-turn-helix domain-containing protein [Rhodospirillaceae bacterium]